MARKKHLINVHTSTGTTAPTEASLYLGEIAVQHTPNDPALWIKVGSAETSTEYEKFIGLTEITNIFNDSKILGSGYTYSGLPYVNSSTTIADAYSALTKEMFDDEMTIAAALNDLNDRINNIPEPVDIEPLSASVVANEANIEVISGWVDDNELVTAAALNDLNDRLNELSAATPGIDIVDKIKEDEEVTAAALNDLNERVGTIETHFTGDYIPLGGYVLSSAITEDEILINSADTVNDAFGKLQKQILDDEEVIAAGMNDLDERVRANAEAIAQNTGVTALSGAVVSLSAGTVYGQNALYEYIHGVEEETDNNITDLSGAVQSVSAKTNGVLTLNLNGVEQGKYSPSANTTINLEAIQEVTGADVLLTGYEISCGTTEEELTIVATDTVNEAFGKIQKQNLDNEAVVAGALNDLNERIVALEADSGLSTDLEALSASVVSNQTSIQELSAVTEENELVTAAALNDLDSRVSELSGNSVNASDFDNLSAAVVTLSAINEDNEFVISNALNDLNARIVELSAATPDTSDLEALSAKVVTDEIVIAASLNDLNARLINLSGKTNTIEGGFSPIIDNLQSLSGAVVYISGNTGGGGGADVTPLSAAVISLSAATTAINTTVDTVSGAAHSKITSLSAGTTAHTANTTVHITSTERTRWNTAWTSGVSAYTRVNALSSGTVTELAKKSNTGHTHAISEVTNLQTTLDGKSNTGHSHAISEITNLQTTLNGKSDTGHSHSEYASSANVTSLSSATVSARNTLTAHTGDTGIHVTSTEKSTWNGKQDAISDLATIRNNASSGAAAYTAVTAHTGNGDIHVTSTQKTNWTNSGTSGANAYVGYITHSANTTIHVTASEKSTWNGKQDTITDLSTIRNNASSGAAAYTTVTAHTGNTSIHVPSHTSSDSGKVLSVDSNGNLVWITPVSIYTGSGQPSSSLGTDGDIYLQTS